MGKMFNRIRWWFKINIMEELEYFLFDHYDNGICGPGYSSHKEFKWGKLAFIISVLTLVAFILYIILT